MNDDKGSITAEQLETLFKRYQHLFPLAANDVLYQEPGHYWIQHCNGPEIGAKFSNMDLSGHWDVTQERLTVYGYRDKAYRKLLEIILSLLEAWEANLKQQSNWASISSSYFPNDTNG